LRSTKPIAKISPAPSPASRVKPQGQGDSQNAGPRTEVVAKIGPKFWDCLPSMGFMHCAQGKVIMNLNMRTS
jgi:hypothetical protein